MMSQIRYSCENSNEYVSYQYFTVLLARGVEGGGGRDQIQFIFKKYYFVSMCS